MATEPVGDNASEPILESSRVEQDLREALSVAPPHVVGRVLAALAEGWTGIPGRLSIIVDHGPRGASVRKVFEEAQRRR